MFTQEYIRPLIDFGVDSDSYGGRNNDERPAVGSTEAGNNDNMAVGCGCPVACPR